MNLPLPWLLICATILAQFVLWLTAMPLGVPGEWVWNRVSPESDVVWNLIIATVSAVLYLFVVRAGWFWMKNPSGRVSPRIESFGWLSFLVVMAFGWIWIVQEAAPSRNRLGKSAFVLYYPNSSGYFTKARYEQPNSAKLLAGYESLMRERDVLHVGTHPPGLFLVFHGLIALCESPSLLTSFLDATQPESFRDACEVIASNSVRSQPPRPLLALDRRVLWLATLLVMASASLTVVPLYGVVRLSHDRATAWLAAGLWPVIPSLGVFSPKSDVVYAFIGMMFVWCWLCSVQRRSVTLGIVSGLIAWCGLMCSLAFLPVYLFAAMASCNQALSSRRNSSAGNRATSTIASEDSIERTQGGLAQLAGLQIPPWKCVIASLIGFGLPTWLMTMSCQVNLPVVWWLNYENHAGFYEHYVRTYWKWLLVNPLELSFAAGVPVSLLAAFSLKKQLSGSRSPFVVIVFSMLCVWGLLWLTGKNSGEAARLWIILMPWLPWLAAPLVSEAESKSTSRWLRPAWLVLGLQLLTSLLTVSRVNGFHHDI